MIKTYRISQIAEDSFVIEVHANRWGWIETDKIEYPTLELAKEKVIEYKKNDRIAEERNAFKRKVVWEDK